MKKRLITCCIVFLIITVMACIVCASTVPTISVESKNAIVGSTVTVEIHLSNNPGISGAKITISYDNCLKLIDAVAGENFSVLDFTMPGILENKCSFTWDSENSSVRDDGVLLTLSFVVSGDAPVDKNANIYVSYDSGDIYNADLENVDFTVINGSLQIADYVPGDVNGDFTVNGKDVTLLRRFNAGGYGVVINEKAADVNDDDTINGKDVTLIRRANAGGYNVTLIRHTERHTHSIRAIAAQKPTCQHDGNIAYWYCADCGKYFSEENGYYEIPTNSVLLKATGHTYSDAWSFDETEHWHSATCEHIAEKKDVNEHSMLNHVCSVCGYDEGFSVVFADYNGAVISIQNVVYGGSAIAPQNPVRNNYIFNGWDKPFDIITDDMTITATYLKQYTVSFVDYDGKIIKTEKVIAGNSATPPFVISEIEGYVFDGWDGEYTNVLSNITIYATYRVKTYTVVFKMPNGETIHSSVVEHGYTAEAPNYSDIFTEQYFDWNNNLMGRFSGWDKSLTNVRSDMTVYAVYDYTQEQPAVFAVDYDKSKNSATLTLCMPSGYSLYAVNLLINYETVLGQISIDDATVNSASKLYEYGTEGNNISVNNKTKEFSFTWAKTEGVTFGFSKFLTFDLSLDGNRNLEVNSDTFRILSESSLIVKNIAEDGSGSLSVINPTVVYRSR